jgi:hypothetical protein
MRGRLVRLENLVQEIPEAAQPELGDGCLKAGEAARGLGHGQPGNPQGHGHENSSDTTTYHCALHTDLSVWIAFRPPRSAASTSSLLNKVKEAVSKGLSR